MEEPCGAAKLPAAPPGWAESARLPAEAQELGPSSALGFAMRVQLFYATPSRDVGQQPITARPVEAHLSRDRRYLSAGAEGSKKRGEKSDREELS